MRVFLDTEFTNFSNPRLISVGLVAENGQEFYCELADGWAQSHCTDFVLDTVLPLLDGVAVMKRDKAGEKLVDWLASLGGGVSVVSDTEIDWYLLDMLIYPHVSDQLEIDGKLLSWPRCAMARRHEALIEELLGNEPSRHHALVDARALKQVVLQTEAEFQTG